MLFRIVSGSERRSAKMRKERKVGLMLLVSGDVLRRKGELDCMCVWKLKFQFKRNSTDLREQNKDQEPAKHRNVCWVSGSGCVNVPICRGLLQIAPAFLSLRIPLVFFACLFVLCHGRGAFFGLLVHAWFKTHSEDRGVLCGAWWIGCAMKLDIINQNKSPNQKKLFNCLET